MERGPIAEIDLSAIAHSKENRALILEKANLFGAIEEESIAKTVHVDGGAFLTRDYKFHSAYFTVVDDKGRLIHHEKNIGDIYSGVAEYRAIEWAVNNIKERPLRIYSDCTVAISWAKRSRKAKAYKKYGIVPPSLEGVWLQYKGSNLADIWNAKNHSPKYIKKSDMTGYNAIVKKGGREVKVLKSKNEEVYDAEKQEKPLAISTVYTIKVYNNKYVDIDSDYLAYTNIGTHHGLQSDREETDPTYAEQKRLLGEIRGRILTLEELRKERVKELSRDEGSLFSR
ncbi:MAG: hypothetical protein DDT22_00339 [candidate division WS2 bacterium]|nr:hypothetical protein [Candidatus Lithacetigena glycinireducens]